jgi:hypothetical protein
LEQCKASILILQFSTGLDKLEKRVKPRGALMSMALSERQRPDRANDIQTAAATTVLPPTIATVAPPLTTASRGYKERAQG